MIRQTAVAGIFYPADSTQLQHQLQNYLDQNPGQSTSQPKALVVPHAGYKYSAAIAASAYNLVRLAAGQIRKVVLLGPAHRVALDGIALPESEFFSSPLGDIPLDHVLAERIRSLPQVVCNEAAHLHEHSLEVQLPFLQQLLPAFELLPLVVGRCPVEQVVEVLEQVWGGDETLLVFSSDLSHYLAYVQAQRIDRDTCQRICRLEGPLHGEQACGCYALNGLLELAKRRNLRIELLDLRNSGDTAGDRHRVVGYGAFAVY